MTDLIWKSDIDQAESTNADALSKTPVRGIGDEQVGSNEVEEVVYVALELVPGLSEVAAFPELAELQWKEAELAEVFYLVQDGVLPANDEA